MDQGQTELNDTIDTFVMGLLERKDIEGIPEEMLAELAAEVKGLFLNYLNMSIIASLPEDKQAIIADLDGSPEEMRGKIDAIIDEANLDMEAISKRATQEFADMYLAEDEEE